MADKKVIVVGAGISGMSAAAEIARSYPVTLVDRLPVIGGLNTGYEDKLALQLADMCHKREVKFLLGTTALRWTAEHRLLIVGPTGINWLEGDHLVYAGGLRPSTQAELTIAGERLAGVLQATVAYHLLEAGIRLGRHVVVIGFGDWADRTEHLLKEQGCYISSVDPDPTNPRSAWCDAWWSGWRPDQVEGLGRINALTVSKTGCERIVCDAVILAARMTPLRNIDGAVFEDHAEAVTFIQLVADLTTPQQRIEYARRESVKALSELEGVKL